MEQKYHYFSLEFYSKKSVYTHAFFLLLLIGHIFSGFSQSADSNSHELIVHFFGSPTCGECIQIRNDILNPLSKKYPENLKVQIHDIDTEEGFQLLIDLEKQYKVLSSSAQTLFLPDTFLTGAEDILSLSGKMIEKYLENPSQWSTSVVRTDSTRVDTSSFKNVVINRFKEFTFLGILLAGLADGINPCAIATMIFLISFLAMQKRKRNEILIVGLSFTAAVFFTYLLMGVGAFKALSFLSNHLWISKVVKWVAVVFAGVVGLVCFRDAIVYRHTGKAKDIKLQLPKPIKMQIHKVISSQLSGTSLVIGAIVTGFLVTLLEAVCTGQVYLPTIVLMTRQDGLKLTGWLYLVFYNVLFVLPLLVVMILAYYGMTWEKLSKKMQNHLVQLKVILGSVLLALAAFLVISL
ncbi:MAG: hypothetical protein JW915_13580 [Chitinispirillaceae bacterium]|nr:hypothetical protein [Chitinispirillaceae bacterium]